MRAVARDTPHHSPFDKIEERVVNGRPDHHGNRDGREHNGRPLRLQSQTPGHRVAWRPPIHPLRKPGSELPLACGPQGHNVRSIELLPAGVFKEVLLRRVRRLFTRETVSAEWRRRSKDPSLKRPSRPDAPKVTVLRRRETNSCGSRGIASDADSALRPIVRIRMRWS